jgi:hypothetical protein
MNKDILKLALLGEAVVEQETIMGRGSPALNFLGTTFKTIKSIASENNSSKEVNYGLAGIPSRT